MSRHVLAIDQGTTNTKALLVDEHGKIVAQASRPVAIGFPQPGWVEQDGWVVWRSVQDAVTECLLRAPGRTISAVALTNQRESVMLWERTTGVPVGPVIVWQCRRTTGFCDTLRARGLQDEIEAATGLTLDPLFSASKLNWLLTNLPDALKKSESGELCAGTIDSWLLWNLTKGTVHACDATNASRTQLLNLQSTRWDPAMLSLFGIPATILPTIHPSSGVFAEVTGIPALKGVPIGSAIGDSHAALFGHAAFGPGQVKATYGTGSSLMAVIPSPSRSRHGLSTTIAWDINHHVQFAFEGNITVTGSAVEWISQILAGAATDAKELAASTDATGGVYFVPALAGLGAPYWDANARGLICGLSRGTTAAHIARATLDSIAYQIRDVFEAMCDDSTIPSALLADGGASLNDTLMQFQADILGVPVIRSSSPDVSALGAAWLAGLAVGIWHDMAELARLPRELKRFDPSMTGTRREQLYAGWREAVSRTRTPRSQPETRGHGAH
ncbi:MAG: glycerol kinase GlpK [Vicinamibacterales bacterium]